MTSAPSPGHRLAVLVAACGVTGFGRVGTRLPHVAGPRARVEAAEAWPQFMFDARHSGDATDRDLDPRPGGRSRAVRALRDVILPDPRLRTHSAICNPGGPGTVPLPQDRYTQPSPGQTMAVEFALRDPATVSWAAQGLSAYDQADDLAVAFRAASMPRPHRRRSIARAARRIGATRAVTREPPGRFVCWLKRWHTDAFGRYPVDFGRGMRRRPQSSVGSVRPLVRAALPGPSCRSAIA